MGPIIIRCEFNLRDSAYPFSGVIVSGQGIGEFPGIIRAVNVPEIKTIGQKMPPAGADKLGVAPDHFGK